ncbi:MAG: hypothetical protein KBD00_02460 [Candidatus Peribacteraceae bacterium]|nr:hypothetical protein [Candidatus Peribacteraceae bacterium]
MAKLKKLRSVRPTHALYGILALIVAVEGLSLLLSDGYAPFTENLQSEVVTTIPQPKVFVDRSGFAMQYPESWGEPRERVVEGVDQFQFGQPVTVMHVPLLDDSHRVLTVDEAVSKHVPGDIANKEPMKFNGMNATRITYKDKTNRYAIVVNPTRSNSQNFFIVHVTPSENKNDAKIIDRALQTFALLRT